MFSHKRNIFRCNWDWSFFFCYSSRVFFLKRQLIFWLCDFNERWLALFTISTQSKQNNKSKTNYLHFRVSFGKYFAALTLFMNSSISTLCSLEIHFSSFYFAYVQPNHFCFTMKNVSFTFISRLKKIYGWFHSKD